MRAYAELMPLACLHILPVQLYFLSLWKPHRDSLLAMISISQTLVIHLQWSIKRMNIFRGIPSYQEEPDASVMKLGAHLDTLQMVGIWNGSQQNHHIN